MSHMGNQYIYACLKLHRKTRCHSENHVGRYLMIILRVLCIDNYMKLNRRVGLEVKVARQFPLAFCREPLRNCMGDINDFGKWARNDVFDFPTTLNMTFTRYNIH